ncbi:NmrA family protein [Flagelloscypha sp. PMI_526]|nr:NmrA family protein [Flagelloscypha sp. PMI_526]
MVKILVTGATGQQGGAVINRLRTLRSGNEAPEPVVVYALTRNPGSTAAKELAKEGIHIVKGDLNDSPETLTSALASNHINRAFLVTDPRRGTDKEAEAGQNFVRSAQNAGLEHIVFSSVEGAQRQTNVPHFESKFEVEKALKSSGLGYTILRPVAFMDNFPLKGGFLRFMVLGVFRAALGTQKPIQLVAVQDIGHFGAEALVKPKEYAGEEIGLAGDELTVSQVAAAYGKVQYGGRWNAWVAWIPSFLLYLMPYDARQMFKFFGNGGYIVNIHALRNKHLGLLSFEEYLRLKYKGGK